MATGDPNMPLIYVPTAAAVGAMPALSVLDSPVPKLDTLPMEPIQMSNYIPVFTAVNRNSEPHVSFPPSPAESATDLSGSTDPMRSQAVAHLEGPPPGSAEYETRFIRANRRIEILRKRRPEFTQITEDGTRQLIIKPGIRGEDIGMLEARVNEYTLLFKRDDTDCRWQAYLIIAFLVIEAVSTRTWLNLPATDFTWSQWTIMSDYEEMLMELAEEEIQAEMVATKNKGNPYLKLLKAMTFYFLMFIGINYAMQYYKNKEHGEKLKEGLWQLMRGNRTDKSKEGPDLQHNAVARLLANAGALISGVGLGGDEEKKPAPQAPSNPVE